MVAQPRMLLTVPGAFQPPPSFPPDPRNEGWKKATSSAAGEMDGAISACYGGGDRCFLRERPAPAITVIAEYRLHGRYRVRRWQAADSPVGHNTRRRRRTWELRDASDSHSSDYRLSAIDRLYTRPGVAVAKTSKASYGWIGLGARLYKTGVGQQINYI